MKFNEKTVNPGELLIFDKPQEDDFNFELADGINVVVVRLMF